MLQKVGSDNNLSPSGSIGDILLTNSSRGPSSLVSPTKRNPYRRTNLLPDLNEKTFQKDETSEKD